MKSRSCVTRQPQKSRLHVRQRRVAKDISATSGARVQHCLPACGPTCTCWPQHGGWVVDGRTVPEWAGAAAQESIRGQCTRPGPAVLPQPGGEANRAAEGGWRAVGCTHLGLQPVQAPPPPACIAQLADDYTIGCTGDYAGLLGRQPVSRACRGGRSPCVLRRCGAAALQHATRRRGVVSCDTCTRSCRPALWFSAGWDSRRHAPRQVRCRTGALPARAAVP